jgi:putative aldouronate transport system substrate-binding protein
VKDTWAFGGFGLPFWTRWVPDAYGLPYDKFKKISGQWKYCGEVPEAKEWVLYLNKLYKEGIMDPEIVVLSGAEGRERLYQGKVAMAGMRIDDADRANDAFKKAGMTARVGVYPPPKSSTGVGGYTYFDYMTNDGVGYWMAASISRNCKNSEAAMKVMDYMVSDEGTELGFFGREGIEYKKPGPRKYEWLVSLEARERLGLPMYINFLSGEPRYGEAADNPWTETGKKYYDAAAQTVYQDYLVRVPFNERMREIFADLGTYCEENLVNFIIGKRPIEEFDSYIAEFERRGGKELLEELTKEMAKLGK